MTLNDGHKGEGWIGSEPVPPADGLTSLHPAQEWGAFVSELARRYGPDAGVIALGVGASLTILFLGLPIPSARLFDLESLIFWGLVLLALIAGLAPLVLRVLPEGLRWRVAQRTWPGIAHLTVRAGAWGLAGALVAFSVPVASLWFTGKSTYYHVGGLLPWSDASGYLFGGTHLLNQGTLESWSMRRPLNAGFLATRLAVTGGDLQLALVLQLWVAAVACYLASRELARCFGSASGILLFALLYQFERPYLGTTLSESLGLSFGCLGFAVLAAAGRAAKPPAMLGGGLTFLTLGLNARAGAFFILPALILWGGLLERAGRLARAAALASALGGVAAGLLLNTVLLAGLGTNKGMAHGNFPVVLYGLAVGGKGWTQVYVDHPEVAALEGEEGGRAAAEHVYRLSWVAITSNPTRFISAYVGGVRLYLQRLFGFVREVEWTGHAGALPDEKVVPLLRTLALLGLTVLFVRFRKPESRFLLLAMAGIFISAPFLVYDGGTRAFATTLPFDAALPAVGLAALRFPWSVAFRGLSPVETRLAQPAPRGALLVGAVLSVAVTIGPLLAVAAYERLSIQPATCNDGLFPVVFRLGVSSPYLRIVESAATSRGRVPTITYGQFRADPAFGHVELAPALRKVRPGSWVVQAFDLQTGSRNYSVEPGVFEYSRRIWVIAAPDVVFPEQEGAHVLVCGERDRDVAGPYIVLHARRIWIVHPVKG